MWRTCKHYWDRPAGFREALAVAFPLVISTSSWTLMQFIDRMFLLWYSPQAMAASFPAGMLNLEVVVFFMGLASYVNTFVAQYHGAGRPQRIGLVTWQGVWLGVLTFPLIMATIPLAEPIFNWAGHPADVVPLEVIYYRIMSYGASSIVISAALSSFFTGRGHVWTVMVVDTIAALINVVLDYAWIFGHWGFPEWGMDGAAWATVVALWAKTGIYLALMMRRDNRTRYGVISGMRFDWPLTWRLLRFGSPHGLQFVLDLGTFTTFLLVVGRLGALELTASNLAFNINNLAFMPIWGCGIAVMTMVGQHLGEDRPELAARATWSTFWLATAYTLAMGAVYVLFPDWFLGPYRGEMDAETFRQLRELTVVLLWFVAGYCVFDMANVIFVCAIKGAGDTWFVFYTSASLAVLMVAATWGGVVWGGGRLMFAWSALLLWILAMGVVYGARFVQGRWKTMRVIEPQVIDGLDDDDGPQESQVLLAAETP